MTTKPSTPKNQPSTTEKAVPWWQKGIIYQIYVRSFYDSNGDGVGDLPGITAKLDYLQELGVDGIWLSPVNVSANADWGYDVVDYYDIEPAFGTMADFDRLIAEAKQRNIKVLMDFVPNHTSVSHPWFKNALTGRNAKYRDYYIWADPRSGKKPPNNWQAYVGTGSAWTYHRPTNQYYLHNFFPEQADLNWRNPKVKSEFDDIMRFWLGRGIAGFRIDVFNMLIKDRQLRDNPKNTDEDGIEVKLLGQKPIYNTSRPEIHHILKHWRKVADENDDGLLLGESTLTYSVRQLAAFYGAHDELELAFNLAFIQAPFQSDALKRVAEETYAAIARPDWPVWTGSNHDSSRFPSRWARGDERKIRCGLMMMLTLEGTPVIYYGDELGMTDTFVPPWRLKDPRGKRLWPVDGGRDRARSPMQWKHQEGAGFTEPGIRPWLPYGDLKRNVAEERRRADSTWKFTRDLIELRRKNKDLHLGEYQTLPSPQLVWAWARGEGITVVINFSDQVQKVAGINGAVLIGTDRKHEVVVNGELELQPWEGVVIKTSSLHGRGI